MFNAQTSSNQGVLLMKKLDVALICALVGMLTLTIGVELEESRSIKHTDLALCSAGQNLGLRNTSGIATYRVTFKDGDAIKFDCVKPTKK